MRGAITLKTMTYESALDSNQFRLTRPLQASQIAVVGLSALLASVA
jgi:hypothetical protein